MPNPNAPTEQPSSGPSAPPAGPSSAPPVTVAPARIAVRVRGTQPLKHDTGATILYARPGDRIEVTEGQIRSYGSHVERL